jgi:hypothetical protein
VPEPARNCHGHRRGPQALGNLTSDQEQPGIHDEAPGAPWEAGNRSESPQHARLDREQARSVYNFVVNRPPVAAEQQPAPESVVLVAAAEGVQLDRLQRQHQRLLRVCTAQDRRLNLPPVTPQETPPFVPTQPASSGLASPGQLKPYPLGSRHRAHDAMFSSSGYPASCARCCDQLPICSDRASDRA